MENNDFIAMREVILLLSSASQQSLTNIINY